MQCLMLTADRVGVQSGGGVVTKQEYEALKSFTGDDPCYLWDHSIIEDYVFYEDPWKYDQRALWGLKNTPNWRPDICHVYAGTFSNTVEYLKSKGTKITYTAAAHDVDLSRKAHEMLGIPFNYPHLNDPELWKQYLKGYLLADVLICPSKVSAETKRKYGYKGRIEIIPHGVDISPKPLVKSPKTFTVGYLGAIGADKGLVYLLQAWKELNYTDGSRLVFAGKDSQHPWFIDLASRIGCDLNTIGFLGWQKDVNDFYDGISVYVQPSITEGFGIEVLESMSRGRPALVSVGAGAADVVKEHRRFAIGDVKSLMEKINVLKQNCTLYRQLPPSPYEWTKMIQDEVVGYTWDKIRQQYVDVWKSLV